MKPSRSRVLSCAIVALGAGGCAYTRATALSTNATGSRVHVVGYRLRYAVTAAWIERNLEWDCARGVDERLVCAQYTSRLPAP